MVLGHQLLIPTFGEVFSPASIPDLALWLDSDDLSTLFTDSAGTIPAALIGDVIGRWADKSGFNRHALQGTTANKPTREIGGITSDGVDDFLGVTVAAGTFQTVIFVARNVGTGNNRNLFGWDAMSAGIVHNNAFNEWRYETNEADVRVDLNEDASTRKVLSLRYASTLSVEFDSNTQSDITFDPKDTYNTTANFGLFAGSSAGTSPLEAEIVEVIAYLRDITDDELDLIMTYAINKWGI